MNIINNGNSFLLLKYRLTFAAGIKNKIDVMNAIIGKKELTVSNKNLSDALYNSVICEESHTCSFQDDSAEKQGGRKQDSSVFL